MLVFGDVSSAVWNTQNFNFWDVHLFGGQKVTAGLCTMHTALVAGKAGLNHLWFVDAASCRHLKAWGTGGGYPLVSRYGNGNLETWKLRLTFD